MSHSHMVVQKRYRESVSPDPAVESGLLAMVDGVYRANGSYLVHSRSDLSNAIDEFTAVNREHWMRTLVNPL